MCRGRLCVLLAWMRPQRTLVCPSGQSLLLIDAAISKADRPGVDHAHARARGEGSDVRETPLAVEESIRDMVVANGVLASQAVPELVVLIDLLGGQALAVAVSKHQV